MTLPVLGKWLIVLGALAMIIGCLLYFFPGKLGWIGRLPGDIRIERENFRFYFPLTTLLIINLVIWLLIRGWRWLS